MVAVADRKEVVAAGAGGEGGGRCQLQWGHERASGLTCFRGAGLGPQQGGPGSSPGAGVLDRQDSWSQQLSKDMGRPEL